MVHYSDLNDLQAVDVANLFEQSGIKRPYDDLRRIENMLERADVIISAWDGEKLVGIARALTDFVYCCYLSDLAVDREYQHKGIGKVLVRQLQTKIGDQCSLVLISAPGAMDYYPKIGFTASDRAFVIPRKR